MKFKILQFFQNLNKNIDIISCCRINVNFFIFIIIIIYLLYNIGFISYMEENIDCFEECSLKDIDESILLKEINELKNLKIEELSPEDLNIEENTEEKGIKNIIILYIIDTLEYIMYYCMLNVIFDSTRSILFYLYGYQKVYDKYNFFKESYNYNKVFFLLELFVFDPVDIYILFGICLICEEILIYLFKKF